VGGGTREDEDAGADGTPDAEGYQVEEGHVTEGRLAGSGGRRLCTMSMTEVIARVLPRSRGEYRHGSVPAVVVAEVGLSSHQPEGLAGEGAL